MGIRARVGRGGRARVRERYSRITHASKNMKFSLIEGRGICRIFKILQLKHLNDISSRQTMSINNSSYEVCPKSVYLIHSWLSTLLLSKWSSSQTRHLRVSSRSQSTSQLLPQRRLYLLHRGVASCFNGPLQCSGNIKKSQRIWPGALSIG